MEGKHSQLKNCKKCGRTFTYYGMGHMYCNACTKIDRQTFEIVKDFIYENGAATISEIAEGTGVSQKQVELYLKEGRLEIPDDSPVFIKCEKCGREMKTGRFCTLCASKLTAEFKASLNYDQNEVGEEAKEKGKMHYMDGKGESNENIKADRSHKSKA